MPKEKLKVSAPGRICLFGEHQDYLQLPVIASAINLRLYIEGKRREDSLFNISLPDINETYIINPNETLNYKGKRDYLRSAINVLKREGLNFSNGYDVKISSQIPINSGLSGSSALVVAWLKFLLASQDLSLKYSLEQIAELAFKTEVFEFKEAGGKMDHYTLSLGKTLYIDTRNPVKVERLNAFSASSPNKIGDFVLGNSLEKKDTIGTLKNLKEAVTLGLEYLNRRIGLDRYNTSLDNFEALPCTEPMRNKIKATFINRDITQKARLILKKEKLSTDDQKNIGELLNRHQQQLRNLGLSTEKLDDLIESSLNAGAFGAKLTGSGCGGCMFAYCPAKQEQVKRAIEKLGGIAYLIQQDFGVSLHSSHNES